jgi:hypothetical protein
MKKRLLLLIIVTGLFSIPVFAAAKERPSFVLFLDAGVPFKGAEHKYDADFGKSFLGLAAQVRLAGNFYFEGTYAYYLKPRPDHEYYRKSTGSEITLDGLWKITPGKKVSPFVKLGLSLTSLSSSVAGISYSYREKNVLLSWKGGGGIEYKVGGAHFLRLGGVINLAPIYMGESKPTYWIKLFAGLGLRFK